MSITASLPLISVGWPSRPGNALARAIVLIAIGSLVLTASAKTQGPMWPVPRPMQTFAVVVTGAIYGARLGPATVVAYLLQGAAGLPAFAVGGGLASFAGPTGGYLFGYVLAAGAVGWL